MGTTGLRPITAKPSKEVGFKITWPLIILLLIIILALIIYGARNIKWKKPKLGLKFPKFTFRKKHKQKIGPIKEEIGTFESEEKKIRRMLRGRGL